MTTKISNILVKVIVFFAVIGIIFLLTMYNAKLLNTLNWFKTSNVFYDKLVIIISSISYSLGSIAVVIWYNPTIRKNENKVSFSIRQVSSILLKIVFVVIDGIHVYVYNNTHIQDLATWLSPVYALQTSLILFFVGSIVNDIIKNGNKKDKFEKTKFLELQTQIDVKVTELNSLQTKYDKIKTDILNFKSDIANKQTNILELESKLQAQQTENKKQESKISELQKYYKFYLKSEASRIRKKKVKNRTEEEALILMEVKTNK